jgi:tetratricopeptide (TPR) repeat protein
MSKPVLPGVPEAFRVDGRPFYPQVIYAEHLALQQEGYKKALADYEKDPDNADNVIWLGRRLAYLGRFRESIGVYTLGLEKHPDDARLLRHRGHRFLSLHLPAQAAQDLGAAAKLLKKWPDDPEPGGFPKRRPGLIASLHFNVWYHLGLAHYVLGDLEAAAKAFKSGNKCADIPDKLIPNTYWLYMIQRQLGDDAGAEKALKPVKEEVDTIDAEDYRFMLLKWKNGESHEPLFEEARKKTPLAVGTLGYGVGCSRLLRGDKKGAVKLWKEVIAGDNWPSFGYIATEAHLHKLGEL